MKRIVWLAPILMLASSLLALPSCGRPKQAASQETPFDALARWVPGDAEQVFFLDLKPDGEAGRHWERIRGRLEVHPTGQQGLDGLFNQFRFRAYGLGELIVGPAVSGYWDNVEYVIAQVSPENEQAARDALLYHFEDVTWEQEAYEGRTLYHGTNLDSWRQRERLAWTVHDGYLFLSYSHVFAPEGDSDHREPLPQLEALVSLDQTDSLAALTAWQTLRGRLPETPMGLLFLNVAEQERQGPTEDDNTSLGAALNRQIEAVALAAVPEGDGMRVEIVGTIALQNDPPEFRALLDLPAVNPVAWTNIPANTAIALTAHNASILWPWLREAFFAPGSGGGSRWPAQLRETIGLDLEADLASTEGPLTDDFALAITPPLADQPIIQGVPAGQLLVVARGASEAQMDNLQAAMEGRGAVFGPGEVEGIALQTQAGTELAGYAISYGFDGDALLLGTSPDIIGQAVTDEREGNGLVTAQHFQAMLAASPEAPSVAIYLNSQPMVNLAKANMTEEQYQQREEYHLFEVFEAIGLSLRFAPDELSGVAYFFVPE